MKDLGVKLGKIGKTLKEIERKTFHLCGLLVPLIYALLLEYGLTRRDCAKVVCLSIPYPIFLFDFGLKFDRFAGR
eukprot:1093010-Amorphochlora_amoeboformis.AAC.2